MSKEQTQETAKQVGKFGIVGIINTLVDLTILNVLNLVFGIHYAIANTISVSVAIVNSYILNKSWTFKDNDKHIIKQFAIFFILSLIGLLINNSVLILLKESLTFIPNFFVSVVHFLRLNSVFSDNFVALNSAKAFAILASMVWNFITYKKFAFNKK